jgi:large subunit ribosomal protein L22
MAFGVKTNERPGTRAQVRHARFSAYKAREVLDLIRDEPVGRALEILQFSERDPAIVIGKCLASAVANAEHNDALPADELYVSSCYADEGPTLKRWRPRARGRATRIRKRTCHITVIVSRYSDEQMATIRRRDEAKAASSGGRSRTRDAAASRRRRVARSRGEDVATEAKAADAEATDEVLEDEVPAEAVEETTTEVTDAEGAADDTAADEEAVEAAVAEAGTDDTAADEQVVEEAAAEADADDATEEQD